jgi:hypothetical protein
METPARKVQRLLGSLETLFDHAQFLVNAGEYSEVVDVQDRCQPLVDEIARLVLQPGVNASLDAETQARANRLLRRQLETIEKIASDKDVVREQLQVLSGVQAKTQLFRSAYGQPPTSRNSSLIAGQA